MKKSTRDNILDAAFMLVYRYGYNGTSTAMILKECNIPKGSLYHYFPSKKELVMAVLKERIAPKMDLLFEVEFKEGETWVDNIEKNIRNISNNKNLIKYGCPLNRLNQEMGSIDEEFAKEIDKVFNVTKKRVETILNNADIDDDTLSEYIVTAVWGALSLNPIQSSKERFLNDTKHLIKYLRSL